jgi:glycosyltransferase involved in cell wall biosynthesis
MRVVFLDSWPQQVANGSGTAAAIGGLGHALRERGHHVVRLAPFAAWPRSLTLRRLLYNMQLPALLRVLPYDLAVGFDIDGVLLASAPGASSASMPYVCSIKGVLAEERRHERGGMRALGWGLSQLERLNARRAPLVLTTSDYARCAIGRHYGVPSQRVRMVPEGIDLAGWQRALAEVAVPRDPFGILCVARQYSRKRIADLLRAFAHIHTQEPRARLTMVGDGPQHAALRRLADELRLGDALHLAGALPDSRAVLAHYARNAIFCLPSVQEGFGIVFLEAMASGLPIVGTTATAVPEVVPQRRAGILVPPADPLALAAALLELLQQPDLRREYAAFGQVHVRHFDWPEVAGRFLAAVQDVVEQAS